MTTSSSQLMDAQKALNGVIDLLTQVKQAQLDINQWTSNIQNQVAYVHQLSKNSELLSLP